MNDGNDIPQIGVSAFRTDIIETTKAIITNKIDIGIRHFEIAELFGNGHTVTESYFSHPRVQSGDFERKDMFLTLKIWPKDRKPAELIAACRETLEFAGLTYADLVLVHAPIEIGNRFEQWKTLEEMVSLGLTKSLGVANITGLQLADLLKNSNIAPAVFEMEVTPFNPKADIVEICEDNSIVVLNYEPLAKGIRRTHPTLTQLASRLEIPVEQLLIRWSTTKKFGVLLPPNCPELNIEKDILLEPLSVAVMEELDLLDEQLATTWVPTEDDDHDG